MGFKKDKSGELVEIYITPTTNQPSTHQRRNLLSQLGICAAGITGNAANLKKLEPVLDKLVNKMSSTSRRNFLKAGAIAAGSIGLASCSKDVDMTGTDELEVPIPVITGPTELSIPKIGGHVKGTFNSSESKGTITELAWILRTPCSLEPRIIVGYELEVIHNFSVPGNYTLELIADNSAGRSIGKHEITVHPPELPKDKYDLPLAFLVVESPEARGRNKALYTLDVTTMEVTRIFGSKRFHYSINWSPTGEKIVFTYEPENYNYPFTPVTICTYNLLTGSINKVSTNGSGLAWHPSWSPTGEWIAYVDDSRAPGHHYDEIALVRPTGSGQFYLGGNTPNPKFSGLNVSWNPEGTALVVSGSKYTARKLMIIRNLFSGNPSREYLPTNEQFERFYDNGNFTEVSKDIFLRVGTCGGNGIAWSPDGRRIAYNIMFAEIAEVNGYSVLVVSNADGTGDIETLAISTTIWNDVEFSGQKSPTWSPDGEAIYFTAWSYLEQHLYKIDLKTKIREMLLENIMVKNVSYYD